MGLCPAYLFERPLIIVSLQGIPKVCPGLSCLIWAIDLYNLPPVLSLRFVSCSPRKGRAVLSEGKHSERYPLTSQLIQENKIPEFGNGAWATLKSTSR